MLLWDEQDGDDDDETFPKAKINRARQDEPEVSAHR
jgi:hypothetical protein